MQGIFILVFQLVMIILYGIFIRIEDGLLQGTWETGLFFIVGYAFLGVKVRNLDWTGLSNYLFVVMITMQINTLYYYFWWDVFHHKFTATQVLSSQAMISGIEASLTIMITSSLFLTKFTQLSLFVLVLIQSFFWIINYSICRWGINSITGGGVMTIWLFGLIFGTCIKKIKYDRYKDPNTSKYFTKTLQVISLIIVIIIWPSFNQLIGQLDGDVKYLLPGNLMQKNAYIQTWLCLFSAITTTMGLRAISERMSIQKIISSIINTGILISSCACVIIDPFASILVGVIGPSLCFVYQLYGGKVEEMGYPIDGIAMAVLGGILSAIFCGGRNGRNPGLSVHPLRQGGLQIAALVVSLIFSIVFGCITGFILRFTGSQNTELTDMGIWQIEPEMMPIYPDDPKLQKLPKSGEKQRSKLEGIQKQRYIPQKQKEIIALDNSILYPQKRVIKQSLSNQSHKVQQLQQG